MMERQKLLAGLAKEKRASSVKLLSFAFIVAQVMTWSRLGTYTSFCMSLTDIESTRASDYMYHSLARKITTQDSRINFVIAASAMEDSVDNLLIDAIKRHPDTLLVQKNDTETGPISVDGKKPFLVTNLIGAGSSDFRKSVEEISEMKLVVGIQHPWRELEDRLEHDPTASLLAIISDLQTEVPLMTLGKFSLDEKDIRRLASTLGSVGVINRTPMKVLIFPRDVDYSHISRDVGPFLQLDGLAPEEADDINVTPGRRLSRAELPSVCSADRRQAREALLVQGNQTAEWLKKFIEHPDVSVAGYSKSRFNEWLDSFAMNPCEDPAIVSPEASILYDQMEDPSFLDPEGGRGLRFPPVQERVKFYMSSWYAPPCEDYPAGFVQYNYPKDAASTLELRYARQTSKLMANRSLMLDTSVENDKLFHVRSDAIDECSKNNPNIAMQQIYCPEIRQFILPFRDSFFEEVGGDIPLIAQMGDAARAKNAKRVQLPHLKKVRPEIDRETLDKITSPTCVRTPRPFLRDGRLLPIIWKLKFRRHFPKMDKLAGEDVPWEEKVDKGIFRGTFTGPNIGAISDENERCQVSPRCKVVLDMANSTLIDAKLTGLAGKVPEVLNGVKLVGDLVTRVDLLRYKALIMLEGNDVSTGLKWALYSNSVVLIPRPTSSSWAMEGLLTPWIHYVPVESDLSDLETKMQWILENDEAARYIAKRGSLWIHDMLFHKQAMEENEAVDREVLRRYRAHFQPMKV